MTKDRRFGACQPQPPIRSITAGCLVASGAIALLAHPMPRTVIFPALGDNDDAPANVRERCQELAVGERAGTNRYRRNR